MAVFQRTTHHPRGFAVLLLATLSFLSFACSPASAPAVKGSASISTRYSSPYDFGSTTAIAVYRYGTDYADLDANALDFTITAPLQVRAVLNGVDMAPDHEFNGTALGSDPSAYLYVRNASGAIHQYRVVLDWDYLLDGADWKSLRRISDSAAASLRSHLKE
jgi:hypothetical protein